MIIISSRKNFLASQSVMLLYFLLFAYVKCYSVKLINQYDSDSGSITFNKTTLSEENLLWKVATESTGLEMVITVDVECYKGYLEIYDGSSDQVYHELCGSKTHRIGIPSSKVLILFHSSVKSNFELKWISIKSRKENPCSLGQHTCSEIQSCIATSEHSFFCSCQNIKFIGFTNGTFETKTIRMINDLNDCKPTDADSTRPFIYRIISEFITASFGKLLYPFDKGAFERQIMIMNDLMKNNKISRRVSKLTLRINLLKSVHHHVMVRVP